MGAGTQAAASNAAHAAGEEHQSANAHPDAGPARHPFGPRHDRRCLYGFGKDARLLAAPHPPLPPGGDPHAPGERCILITYPKPCILRSISVPLHLPCSGAYLPVTVGFETGYLATHSSFKKALVASNGAILERGVYVLADEGPIGLITCPSRELARQTFEVIESFSTALHAAGHPQLRPLLVMGGIDMRTQVCRCYYNDPPV